jgi:hypothetical protein
MLEPYLQFICSGYFWKWGGLVNYLPGQASNLDPPELSLPKREDYKQCQAKDKTFYVYLMVTKRKSL